MNDAAPDSSPNPVTESGQVPQAKVVPITNVSWLSRMWWLAAACLLLAIGLTWMSIDSPGRSITIRFDQGHGLTAGDSIQHRGIEIGRVEEVRLRPDLSGIDVVAILESHADQIARRGSRFWIVHPQVDFGGVRGLETAIGAKYIRVLPGVGPENATQFDGLSIAPPDGSEQEGVEVILRSDDRYGLSVGSPVTFRGIEVGRVLSSRLSPDAKNVDTVVQIVAPHDRLLTTNSKFWKTSGVDIAVSLKGVEFSAQSLATVLRGGVAFATPGPNKVASADKSGIDVGHLYTLHEKANPEWLDSQAAINVLSEPVVPMVAVQATWQAKQFGFTRDRSFRSLGLILREKGQERLVFPKDLLQLRTDAGESYDIRLIDADRETSLLPWMTKEVISTNRLFESLPLSGKLADFSNRSIIDRRIRSPTQPEDCLVVRRTVLSGKEATLLETIGRQDLVVEAEIWRCPQAQLSRDLWHGAPVIAAKDEKCIGMLLVQPEGVQIATWPQSASEAAANLTD